MKRCYNYNDRVKYVETEWSSGDEGDGLMKCGTCKCRGRAVVEIDCRAVTTEPGACCRP